MLGELRCSELGDDSGPIQLCTSVFELYLVLQDISAMVEYAERVTDRPPTTLTTFYTWFETAVHRWLDLAHVRVSNRIRRSVEMNKLCTAELIVKHTTSAMDVSACFYHVSRLIFISIFIILIIVTLFFCILKSNSLVVCCHPNSQSLTLTRIALFYFLQQINEFWKLLNWPDLVSSYNIVNKIIRVRT